MAKRKNKAVAKAGSFILLRTGCGELSQLEHFGPYNKSFTSQGAAQEAAIAHGAEDFYDGLIVVAEILNVGKPTGVTWTGKTTI